MTLLLVPGLVLLLWLASRLRKIGTREVGLPPGPPTRPLLGNLLDFSGKEIYIRITEWAQAYGEIYSLKVGFNTVVVLSGPKAIHELLDKRSASTANRPPFYFADIVLDGLDMGFRSYDATYKIMRRSISTLLSKEACSGHLQVQQAEISQLMYDILKRPEAYFTLAERFSISVIVAVVFGIRCPRHESSPIAEFSRLQEEWEYMITPGHHPPLDLLPILRYVPERWAKWKGISRDLKQRQDRLYYGLLESCEKRIQNNTQNGCFMEQLLQEKEKYGLTRDMVAHVGTNLLQGGSITTTSFLRTLICCLALRPDIQRRAHEEFDRVVGAARTPDLEDLEQLPYIRAIIKEAHRFCPAAPYGLPHYSTSEETYGEYVIPKDSLLVMNIYGLYHDENAYARPTEFDPDRFMDSEFGTIPGTDDSDRRHDFHFGAGRRICPGMFLGNNSTMIAALNVIWGFEFRVAKDPKTGQAYQVDPNVFTEGFVIGCVEFPADIRPRSETHSSLIRSQYAANRGVLQQFEHELSQEDVEFVRSW